MHCLGKCYAAPATTTTTTRPLAEVHVAAPIVLERIVTGGARTLAGYLEAGGFSGLERARATDSCALIDDVDRSGLRGRGGAGFATGKKLRAVAAQPAGERFVVANADEGDPGAFIDRALLEDDPFAVIEGLAIAARAVGAHRGFIYLRREYPDALPILESAIAEARSGGWLGDHALGRDGRFDVHVVVGHGSYLCGEETALLNAIEGRRPFVRARPPYPSERGLFRRPTLVQNIETLVNLPWIVRHGGDRYSALGVGGSRGTKVLALNSLFRRPGLHEVELGLSVRSIVDDVGGGLVDGALRGVIIGGPLAGVIPPALLDARLDFEELKNIGASIGHGGVVAFDERTSVRDLLAHVFSFAAYESCGRCTPCRLGAAHVEVMLQHAPAGGRGVFDEIVSALRATSLCGHGAGLAEFAASLGRAWPDEVAACFA
ncbi:MAG: NADH-ubiquinone oxidoreductase-F iron-sulfur binding region domain-containing protein [Deltaproteobacteria bacterium]|nr:NADH-ubiquinone oxidoreductase-F iron-sulfur binding region domain-containing protein [Deltaproteobacteria bacterium]